MLAIAVLLTVCLLRGSAAAETQAAFSPPQRYAVVLVLDGARPDYFNLTAMPHLRWLLEHGTQYSQAFVGQMIANTPTSHATIGTGLFPKHNGVLGFWWKDPATGRMTRPTDIGPLQTGALEAVLTAHHSPSIAAQIHSVQPGAQVVSVAGHKCYAADVMGGPAANDILCALIYHDRWVAQAVGSHRPPPGAINNSRYDYPIPDPHSGFAPAVEQWNLGGENDWTVRYALWAFHRVHYPRLLMMNLGETDVLGHFATNPRQTMTTLMQHFDRELGQIIEAYRAAGILNQTDFIVTSDHGMTRVRSRISFGTLKQALTQAGAQQVFIEADTAATIGIDDIRKSHQVALNVAHLGGSAIDATYYAAMKDGVPRFHLAYARPGLSPRLLHAYAALVDTNEPDAGGDVMVVYAPHVTTGDRMANGYHWVGGHLGPQWDEQHIPLIIAGPGVRPGAVSSYPARLVDIAPTVERLLGVPVRTGDGVVLSDALHAPTLPEQQRQAAIGASLRPVVAALEARSGQSSRFLATDPVPAAVPQQPRCERLACRISRHAPLVVFSAAACAVLAITAVFLLTGVKRRDP